MPRGSTGSVDVVGVLACAEDRAVADQLAEYLEIAGLTVVAVDSEQVLPGLVVLISEAALADEAWQRLATEQRTARLVPVRLDPVPDERVPDRLAQRQRVDLDLADYVLTWSTVITALRTDPASARIRFDLEVRARNWQQAGYPRDLLIRDGQTLGSYAAVLGDEDDSDAFDPEDPRVAYVIAADGNLRRRRNQRLITVAGTLAIIVAVFLIASEVFGAIQQAELTSRSVMVTTGSNLVNEAPEWAAMHAAAVTLRGTDQEREAARRTLITALALPWGPDVPNVRGGSVEAILPLERSGDPLYLILDAPKRFVECGFGSHGNALCRGKMRVLRTA